LSGLKDEISLVTQLPLVPSALREKKMFSPCYLANLHERGKQMRPAPVPLAKVSPTEVQDVLRSFREHQRLVKLVSTMTLEIERLNDDNVQLHAAVKIYREVARRCHSQALSR
jgi:hypothetical protein